MENKKETDLAKSAPEVTLLNAIGQKQIVPAINNQVTMN